MAKTLIIAEKPSVMADLARVLGKQPGMTKFENEKEYFENDTHIISSAVGHLLELTMPTSADGKKLQWKFDTVPMKPGDPGLDTWPSLDAARHGGGQVWVPGAFDPETRLYIFGTGNPTPGYTGVGRKGDNLYTCSLVAVNVDTGRMAWYFQKPPPWNMRCSQYIMKSASTRNSTACSHSGSVDSGPWPLS